MNAVCTAIAILAAALVIAGCDAAKSAAARAGLAGFEARCEASLPAARIEVVTAPVVPSIDRSRSWRELTSMSGDTGSELRALGLTTAKVGHKASVETTGIESQRDGRVCVRPSIKVELSAMPMTVYIGREIAGDPCREAVALEHEMKHVAVYRDELPRLAADTRALLEASYGNRVLYYGSRADAKRETQAALGAELGPMLEVDARRIKERQRTIDTPEEYARVSAACGGMAVK
jgi:hypothetical protein